LQLMPTNFLLNQWVGNEIAAAQTCVGQHSGKD
jgi:hypothetical protein